MTYRDKVGICIRGIPMTWRDEIQERALRQGLSMNRWILSIIAKEIGRELIEALQDDTSESGEEG